MIVENRGYSPSVGILLITIVSFVWVLWGPYNPYGPIGHVDPWIPLGYALNDLSEFLERYGFTYYVCRLPWLFPVIAVHKIFNVDTAVFLLDFIKVFLSGTFLFLTIAPLYGTMAGLLSAILLIFNPFVASALLTYYACSAAVVYLLGGFWFLLQPPKRFSAKISHIVAGAFFSLAGYTFLIAGLIIAPMLLSVVFYRHHRDLNALVKALFKIAIGVLLVTVISCILSKIFFNEFLFFKPQLRQALSAVNDGQLEYARKGFESWLPGIYKFGILILPFLALLFLVFRQILLKQIASDRSAFIIPVLIGSIGSFLVFGFFDWMQGFITIIDYHCVLFLIPAFLLIGGFVGEISKQRPLTFMVMIFSASAVLAFVFLTKVGILREFYFNFINFKAPLFIFILIFLILICLSLKRLKSIQATLFASFVTIFPCLDVSLGEVFRNRTDEFHSMVKALNVINAAGMKDRHYQFWYSLDDSQINILGSTAALYLDGVSFSEKLSTTSKGNFDHWFRPNTTIIIFSTDPINFDEKLEFLKKHRIEGGKAGNWKITEGSVSFHIGRIDIKKVDSSNFA